MQSAQLICGAEGLFHVIGADVRNRFLSLFVSQRVASLMAGRRRIEVIVIETNGCGRDADGDNGAMKVS